MNTHVAVLMGGWSGEREVSLVSGRAVSDALRSIGLRVTPIDVAPNLGVVLAGLRPDVAFNALHGRFGEDGRVQGLLETLGIPYTHSGVLASALAMNKPAAKRLFAAADIPSPEGQVTTREAASAGDLMDPPYVIKPLGEGSSLGVSIVRVGDNAPAKLNGAWPYGDRILIERYIPGREITVAVMGDRALGVLEIKSRDHFYSYDAKYVAGGSEHLVPASLPADDYEEARSLALAAHRCLGCRGVSRADLRYDDTSGAAAFYMLEVNTQPGMTPTSLVPEIAAAAGISFVELVRWLVEDASCDR
jgi:D-alanine-D-alanine ligase